MNRKGFTLIELIVVIAILAVIGVMVTVNLTKTMNKYTENDCTNFKANIEESACTYAEVKIDPDDDGIKQPLCDRTSDEYKSKGSCTFNVIDLYNYGIIDDEVNKCTGKNLKDSEDTVTVTWNSTGEKICTYHQK